MPVVLPTPDAALVARFSSGDENALVALYRQEYDSLLAAAGDHLGTDLAHYRGRVAHKAMLDAWDVHERFQNPSAFSAFLEEAVRQEADVQRRKHAALHHREGRARSHVTVPTVDEAVGALLGALHAPEADHAKAVEEAHAAKRAHAREHVERVAPKPRWAMYVGLSVLVLGGIYGLQRFLDKTGTEVAVDRALKSEGVQTLSSARGQRGTLTLRDGTRATMGSDTRLRVPEPFGTSQRTVELDGTATFAVTPSAEAQALPFSVRAGGAIITATGTAFTVRHYVDDRDSAVVVQVTEGSVTVRARAGGSTHAVKAGEAVRFTRGTVSPLDDVSRDVALAWTRDSLVFDNTPLSVAIPELVRWFALDAVLADSSIAARPVTMRLALSSSGEASQALTRAADLTITFGKNDRIEFRAAPSASRQ